MEIEILRSTIASGERVEKGETPDVSDKDARILIAMGKAKKVEPKEAKKAPKGGK